MPEDDVGFAANTCWLVSLKCVWRKKCGHGWRSLSETHKPFFSVSLILGFSSLAFLASMDSQDFCSDFLIPNSASLLDMHYIQGQIPSNWDSPFHIKAQFIVCSVTFCLHRGHGSADVCFFYPFNIKYLKVTLHVMFVKQSLLYRYRIEPGAISVRLQDIVSREKVTRIETRLTSVKTHFQIRRRWRPLN